MDAKKFATRLKQTMEFHELTGSNLASITGVSKATLYRLLQGEGIPSIDLAQSLARALDVDLSWLIGLTDKGEDKVIVNPLFGEPANETQFNCDVFMVMPFGPKFDPIYTDIVIPLCTDMGLAIKRGDNFFSKHDIVHEIWSAICNAKLVIADCTDRNPNVFYEVGIAHTIGKPTILMTQDIDDVPFDVRGKRFILYQDRLAGQNKLRTDLQDAIGKVLNT